MQICIFFLVSPNLSHPEFLKRLEKREKEIFTFLRDNSEWKVSNLPLAIRHFIKNFNNVFAYNATVLGKIFAIYSYCFNQNGT